MGICQIIFTIWLALSLGIALAKHGQPHEGEHSFWVSLISAALQIILLYYGGFYG